MNRKKIKTRSKKILRDICPCSPDVGDCIRCSLKYHKKSNKKTRKIYKGGSFELNILYNSKKVNNMIVLKEEISQKPSITIPEGHYLIMYDPDAVNPTWIHWIASSNTDILPYQPPSPPPGTGNHRYIFSLIPGTPPTTLSSIQNNNRGGKNISNLLQSAVATSMFIVVS